MQGNGLDEAKLNQVLKAEIEINEEKKKLYDILQQIKALDALPDGFNVTSITKYDDIELADVTLANGIKAHVENGREAYGIRGMNKRGKWETLLYSLRDEELEHIATINEKNQILMQEQERQRKYSDYQIIKKGSLDKPSSVNKKELENHKIAELDEREIEEKNHTPSSNSHAEEIAKAIGVKSEDILSVIEVKNEESVSRIAGEDWKNGNVYIVKYRDGVKQSTTAVNQNEHGEFEKALSAKRDPSKRLDNLVHDAGIKNNKEEETTLDDENIEDAKNTRKTQRRKEGRTPWEDVEDRRNRISH